MENDKEIRKRLDAISDKEWIDIIDKLTNWVSWKLKRKTLSGAHSEQNLGVNPVNYYVTEAISKLFAFEWEWKFEKFTLLEQLQRIAGSIISANVVKFKKQKGEIVPTEDEILDALLEKNSSEEIDDNNYQLFLNALSECTKDDDELQLYALAIHECNSFDEMSKELGWDKAKLYVLQKKLTRRIIKHLETKKTVLV